jgi:cell division FtsZ-interacting protein ZapD
LRAYGRFDLPFASLRRVHQTQSRRRRIEWLGAILRPVRHSTNFFFSFVRHSGARAKRVNPK